MQSRMSVSRAKHRPRPFGSKGVKQLVQLNQRFIKPSLADLVGVIWSVQGLAALFDHRGHSNPAGALNSASRVSGHSRVGFDHSARSSLLKSNWIAPSTATEMGW